ncbi:MAG: hypothetical protein E6J41_07645, partial [Chloroflexi bacterium]
MSERETRLAADRRAAVDRLLGGRAGAAAVDGRDRIGRGRREGELPLSFAQQRLWFLDRLRPEGGEYNTALGLRLRGRLDRGALEWALGEVVGRHEVLRTVFPEREGRPRQEVREAAGDRARGAERGTSGGLEELELGGELSAGLRELARESQSSLYTVLLAGLSVLLWRYTGGEEVRVGTVVAGRPRSELEGLVGFFVNTLVMRVG